MILAATNPQQSGLGNQLSQKNRHPLEMVRVVEIEPQKSFAEHLNGTLYFFNQQKL